MRGTEVSDYILASNTENFNHPFWFYRGMSCALNFSVLIIFLANCDETHLKKVMFCFLYVKQS